MLGMSSVDAFSTGRALPEAHRITSALVERVRRIDPSVLDSSTTAKIKLHMLDAIGCALAGASTTSSKRIGTVIAGLAGPAGEMPGNLRTGQAPLLYGGHAGVLDSIYLNAVAIHGLEADDGSRKGSLHPAAVVVPAVLAAAYTENCDGPRLLAAMAAGYEVAVRVAEMLHPWSTRNGFHNTPVAGVLGAAAAAGKVFGLSDRQLESALGIAASSASGIFAYLAGGGNVKKIHVGNAARGGYLAACLARADAVDGPMGVLEVQHGLLQCYGGSVDPDQSRVTLDDDFAINHCYLKPYPCCRHLHPAIDAVLSLRNRHSVSPNEITAVDVETFAAAAELRSVEWGSLFSAQLSFPFTLAIAVEFGEVTSSRYAEAGRIDPRVLRHLPKISIREDTHMTAAYPGIAPALVKVRTRSGEVYQQSVRHPLGSSENPLSQAAVIEKFAAQGSARLPQGVLHAIAEQVLHIERCGESRNLLDGLSQATLAPADQHQGRRA